MVANCRASLSGFRYGTISTLVPNLSVDVPAATAPIVTAASNIL